MSAPTFHCSGAGPSTGGQAAPLDDRDTGDAGCPESKKRKREGNRKRKGKERANGDEDPKITASSFRDKDDKCKTKLACPFLRFNPDEYFDCASYNLTNFEAVKLHLDRVHKMPDFYCPCCFSHFENEDDKNQHVRRLTCTQIPGHDEITHTQWKDAWNHPRDSAEHCPRTSKCEIKWIWMWKQFFRDYCEPPREHIYLEESVVEARRLSFNYQAVQSILDTHRSLDTPELTRMIFEAAVRTPSPPGPRRYRFCPDLNDDRGGQGASLGLIALPASQPTNQLVTGLDDSNPGALSSWASHDQSPVFLSTGHLLDHASGTNPGPDPDLPINLSRFSPSLVLPQTVEPGAKITGGNEEYYHTVFVERWATARECFRDLVHREILWPGSIGPTWGAAYPFIDFDAWEQSWAKLPEGLIFTVHIPIHQRHIKEFLQLGWVQEETRDPHAESAPEARGKFSASAEGAGQRSDKLYRGFAEGVCRWKNVVGVQFGEGKTDSGQG